MPKGYRKDGTRAGFQKGQPAWNKGMKGVHISSKTEFKKGRSPWNKGEKCTQFAGENNPAWKEGISKSKFYNRFCLYNQRYKEKYGPLTIETMQGVYEANIRRFGTLTCYLCLKPIEFGKDCLEHKIPLARDGKSNRANLDVAHKICNLKKCNKTEKEYKKVLQLKESEAIK